MVVGRQESDLQVFCRSNSLQACSDMDKHISATSRLNHNHHNHRRLRQVGLSFFASCPTLRAQWSPTCCCMVVITVAWVPRSGDVSGGCGCTGVTSSSCRSEWPWLQRRTTARSPGPRRGSRASCASCHGTRRLHPRGRGQESCWTVSRRCEEPWSVTRLPRCPSSHSRSGCWKRVRPNKKTLPVHLYFREGWAPASQQVPRRCS